MATPGIPTRKRAAPPARGKENAGLAAAGVAVSALRELTSTDPKRAEHLFRALTDHSWERVAILDERGVIRYSSPSSTRIYWYTNKELVGRNCFDFVHPEDFPRALEKFQEVLKGPGASGHLQYRAHRKDGEYIWMETTGRNLLHDPDIRGIVINEREITDRRRSEAELLLTKARLEYLLNATPAVIYAASPIHGHTITFVSENVRRVFGHQKESIIEQPDFWERHIHPDDVARVRSALTGVRPAASTSIEYRLLHGDGSYRFVRTEIALVAGKKHGQGDEVVGYWLDITDRKRVEAALLATLECGEALMRATSEKELLESICRAIVKMGGYRMAWVGFPDPSGLKELLPAARAGAGQDYVDKAKITWAAGQPRGRGPVGRAMRTRKAVACRDLAHDPRFAPWREEALQRGYAAVIALPLMWRTECLGALAIYSDQAIAFQQEESDLLQTLAGDIAYGLAALRTREERERLQRELLEISEREQRRIAQDLHDGLCQQLLGVGFLAGTLQKRLEERNDPEIAAVAKIGELIRASANDARALSHCVLPLNDTPRALMNSLDDFAKVTSRMFSIACHFECQKPVLVAERTVATHLYRIAQEAVGNAIKHGASGRVTIRLHTEGRKQLVLAILDNGKGIHAVPPTGKGMGLQIMRYRAEMCGGTLDIRKSKPGGTLVQCCVPLFRRKRARAQ